MASAIEHFRAGGWVVWFIMIFGLLSVMAALRFLRGGLEGFERFGRWMIGTTLLASVFGFVVGMIKVTGYIVAHPMREDQRFLILLEGTGESLNNVASGLLLATLATLLLALGHRRFMRLGH